VQRGSRAGTTWSQNSLVACISTLHTSAFVVCYSVAEYCCPVLARSSYTYLIDPQLHSAVCLISGCLQPTQLSWLLVLSNVAPPSVRCKAASERQYASNHRSPSKLACVCWCLWASTSTACISTSNMARHDVSTQLRSGERTGRQLLWSTTLLLPTLLSDC